MILKMSKVSIIGPQRLLPEVMACVIAYPKEFGPGIKKLFQEENISELLMPADLADMPMRESFNLKRPQLYYISGRDFYAAAKDYGFNSRADTNS